MQFEIFKSVFCIRFRRLG